MPPEKKDRIEVRFVPLPPEKNEAYKAAIRWLWKLMREALEEQKNYSTQAVDSYSVCSECGCYLHVTTEGKQVCRNEICPNYS